MSPLHRRDWQSERRVICYRTQRNLTEYSHHAHHFVFGHRFPRTIGLESCFKEPISHRKLVLEVIYQAIISEIMPSPPFGTTCLSPSTDVFRPLHKPIEYLPSSTEIHCCPPVLLSVLLSEVAGKMQGVGCFPGLGKKKKSCTMKVNHSCQWRAPFSPIAPAAALLPWRPRFLRG